LSKAKNKMKKRTTSVGKLLSKLLTVAGIAVMGTGMANEVYVEQVGSGSTVNILQEGSDNRIGTSLVPAYIGSGSNTVNIDQIGSNNELDMVVNGQATDVTISTTGSNNIQEIQCGTTGSAGCSGSAITQTIVGDNNTVKQLLGAGANHTSNITVTGDTNMVTHESTATGTTSADITVAGNTNTVSVNQSGMLNHSVQVNSSGNLNSISIIQRD
jgi:hypothetical protein